MPHHRMCPKCDSSDLIRSHRRSWERFFPFLKPFRCNSCHVRFYSFISLRLPSRVL
jgi:hypothetical protein